MIESAKSVKVSNHWADAYVRDHDGVVCWKSNDRCPFADMLGDFLAFGYISQLSYDNSVAAKIEQDNAAMDEFFSRKPSREELIERNANRF
jgi:hypothetical protein